MRGPILAFYAFLCIGSAHGQAVNSPLPTGTSGHVLGFLDQPLTFSGADTFTGPIILQSTLNNVTPADFLPMIDQRAPAQTDGPTQDYGSAYSLWAWHQPSGATRVFQQNLSNAGFPQWQLENIYGNALPGDAATVACKAAWWTRQVVSAYTGPLFRVQFADTTTLDVQQVSGGKPDQTTLWAQTASHGGPARVSIWYDQCGSAYNATQATAVNQPMVTVDRDGDLSITYDEFSNSSTQLTRFLTISTGLSLTQDTVSAFTVNGIRAYSQSEGNVATSFFQLGNTGGTKALQLSAYYFGGLTLTQTGGAGSCCAGAVPVEPTLSWLVTSTTNRFWQQDGQPSYTASGDLGANTITGGVLGMTPGTPSAQTAASVMESSQYGTIVYASTLSAANISAEEIAITALGKTTPQARCNVVMMGESVMEGLVVTGAQAWARQLADTLPKSVRVINLGWSGQTLAGNASQYSTSGALAYNSQDSCNYFVLNGGNTNGWYNSGGTPTQTVAQVQANINTIVAAAIATGYRVFVMTAIDRSGSAATYTQLAGVTASILSNAVAQGYTPIRVDLDPELGVYGVSAQNALCFLDGAHLSAACGASLATDVKAALAPFIKAGG